MSFQSIAQNKINVKNKIFFCAHKLLPIRYIHGVL